jgi:uncharacterized protein
LDRDLEEILHWGSLPGSTLEQDHMERIRFLKSYSTTYLKEEIQVEQIVRNIEPFMKFLPVAAAQSGQVVNFSRIGREAGIDSKSVERYYEILDDTLIGFRLPAYHRSIRKQQTLKPKFFLFDLGVKRHLEGTLDSTVSPRSSTFGQVFEEFIISECFKLNDCFEMDYRFSYLLTKDGAEIDLIVEKGKRVLALVEIKSKTAVHPEDLRHLNGLGADFADVPKWVFSRVERRNRIGDVLVLPWADGLRELFPKLK